MPKLNQVLEESARIESMQEEDKDKEFRIHDKLDICAVLQKIKRKHSLITMYLGKSNNFILTSILAVDTEHNEIIIDYGIDEALNQLALKADRLTFIASEDRIKIDFVCNTIKKMQFEERNAFIVNLPDSLVRMQRRNYFRVVTPTINTLKCIIPLPDGHNTEVALADISSGGTALIEHKPVVNFELGTTFRNCQIILPNVGTVTVTIQVKNTFEVTLKNDDVCKRIGCEFVALPMKMAAIIQRYIMKLEQMARS